MNESISKYPLYMKLIKNRCLTCFNPEEDVNLVPLIEKSFVKNFVPEITFTTEDLVCLECDYMVKKMMRFRNTVLTAQLLLNNAYQQQCQDVEVMLDPTIILKEEHANISTASSHDSYLFNIEIKEKIKQEPMDAEPEAEDPLVCALPITCEVEASSMPVTKVESIATKDNLRNIPKSNKPRNVTAVNTEILRDGQKIYHEGVHISTLRIMNDYELLAYSEAKRNHSSFLGMKMRCELCVIRFRSQKSHEKHMKAHDISSGDYPCGVCQQRFPSNEDMVMHRNTHFIKYICTKCDYEVNALRWAILHHKCCHLVCKRECTLCDAVFDTFRELKNHKHMNHVSREKCIECGLMVRGKRELQMHVARHRGGIPMTGCNICNKAIKLSSLMSHTLYFHKDNIKEAAYCKPCDMQFNNFKLYMSHLRTSNSSKHNTDNTEASFRHKCAKCDTNFETRKSLREHMQTKHSVNYNYQCDKCDKSFKGHTGLKRHVETVHERVLRTRNLICDTCGKAFFQRNTLIEHMNKHTGARPNVCGDCGATFGFKAALFTHRRLKHNVKRKKDLV